MNHWVEWQKKKHRNIFHLKNNGKVDWFNVFFLGIVMSAIDAILNMIVENLIIEQWIMVGLYAVILFLYSVLRDAKEFEPYGATKNFTGLYTIDWLEKQKNVFDDTALVSRETEIDELKKLIKEFLPQKKKVRGICLVGPSGCGKSTLLRLLMKSYDGQVGYDVKNYSDCYEDLEFYIKKDFGDIPYNSIKRSKKKEIIIFDQFERYFLGDQSVRSQIDAAIRMFTLENVVMIFSLREEFFLQFTLAFNMNNMTRVNMENAGGSAQQPTGFFVCSGISKNNMKFERNLLICSGSGKNDNNDIKQRCKDAFPSDNNNEVIFEKYKDRSLIQQQIIFSLLEREKDDNHDYMAFLDHDDVYLMNWYYDVQLSATKDYFYASRIMYLLSLGKLYNIVFSSDDIRDALCISEFGREKERFRKCLDRLEKCKLIQKVRHNTESVYEVAHDFIAKSYETYASTEMDMEVKAALDEYKSEYLRSTDIRSNAADFRKRKKKAYMGWLLMGLAAAVGMLEFFYLRYVLQRDIPGVVLIFAMFCLLYAFGFYMYVARYYRGWQAVPIRACLFACLVCGALSIYRNQFWLQFLGAGTIATGLSGWLIGSSRKLSSKGRKIFSEYGGRTMIMGGLLVIFGMLLLRVISMEGTFDLAMLLKVVAMSVLLAYAYWTHVNEEYYYSRLAAIVSAKRK